MPGSSTERWRAALRQFAREQFGEPRLEALGPELDQLAENLGEVAGMPLPDEDEPAAFPLLE